MRKDNPGHRLEVANQHTSALDQPAVPAVGKGETSTIFSAGQSVVLVGNGFSALRGSRGKQIDEFDVIVRFNRFELAGYEEQIGTRTDVWCRNEAVRGGGTPEIARSSGAWALLLASNHDRTELHQAVIAEFIGKFPSFDLISREVWDYVRGEMGVLEPSSGLLAATHVIQFVSPVYTVGFDCMAAGQKHYFEAGEGSAHSPDAEAGYFRKLLRSGDVVELEKNGREQKRGNFAERGSGK